MTNSPFTFDLFQADAPNSPNDEIIWNDGDKENENEEELYEQLPMNEVQVGIVFLYDRSDTVHTYIYLIVFSIFAISFLFRVFLKPGKSIEYFKVIINIVNTIVYNKIFL